VQQAQPKVVYVTPTKQMQHKIQMYTKDVSNVTKVRSVSKFSNEGSQSSKKSPDYTQKQKKYSKLVSAVYQKPVNYIDDGVSPTELRKQARSRLEKELLMAAEANQEKENQNKNQFV